MFFLTRLFFIPCNRDARIFFFIMRQTSQNSKYCISVYILHILSCLCVLIIVKHDRKKVAIAFYNCNINSESIFRQYFQTIQWICVVDDRHMFIQTCLNVMLLGSSGKSASRQTGAFRYNRSHESCCTDMNDRGHIGYTYRAANQIICK